MRILVILLLLSLSPQAYCQKLKQMAIAFYNVENLFDTINDPNTDDDAFTPKGTYKYTNDIYKQKLHNTAFVIKQIAESGTAPAVVGLAEVENGGVLTDLVNNDQLKVYGYKHISYNSPDPRGIDVALLYQPKLFKPLTSKPIAVRIENNGHTETTRDILFVTGILNGDTVHLFVNHWPSRREGKGETAPKRKQVAAVNKQIIDSLMKRNPLSKIIVIGDLNDDPTDESIVSTLNANSGRERIIPYSLYNPWATLYTSGHGTTAYQNKWNLFDQVIISRAFLKKNNGWQFLKAEIFNKEFLITRSGKQQGYPYRSWRGYHWMNGYSDHLPVLLYLEKH
ncbi:endonuclease/exonuclease/phosphatase [Polluticoccus soli]|uniref:endonuclease/exonuclease/phosphatase family protein n=1 Tax=Polluticoccus soli TaxID=3034150 RepID=UPI0023E34309|nr:endonuclease/exonuclease/phosphatase [Flavipsychrobacter sp. JY13-12]